MVFPTNPCSEARGLTRSVLANQATATQRRGYLDLRNATDGITAETAEAGGQPQISTNGGPWTATGIGILTAIGSGRYYADLTQAAVLTAGTVIETRYKSAATAESPGDSVQVVAIDLDDAVEAVLAGFAAGSAGTDLIIRAICSAMRHQPSNFNR